MLLAAEALRKIAGRGEPQQRHDLRGGIVGVLQHEAALLQAPLDQVVDGGDAVFLLEGAHQMVFVDVHHLGQGVQRDGLAEMLVDVLADQRAVAVGGMLLFGGGKAGADLHVGKPLHLDQQDLQDALAHILIAELLCVHLSQDALQVEQQLVPVLFKIQHVVSGVAAGAVEPEVQPLHAQHQVFQRVRRHAGFGMLHVGVDDDQVVLLHIKGAVGCVELPAPMHAVEQLGALVGVHQAVPVLVVAGRRHIQQLIRFVRSGSGDEIKTVTAHKKASLGSPKAAEQMG